MVRGAEDDSLLSAGSEESIRRRRRLYGSAGATIAPAVVQALVASVQAVSFGLLLLPRSPGGPFEGATAVCCTGWMLSVVLGQVAVCFVSRLPCAVAGGAIEILPLMHAVASGIAQEMEGDSAESVVATALGGIGVLSLVVSVWYAFVTKYSLHSYMRFFPTSALKGALAGVGIYLMCETWSAVNCDLVQMIVAVCLALALIAGERTLEGSWFAPWFNAAFLVGAAVAVALVKKTDDSWFLRVSGELKIWNYWNPSKLPGAPAPWRVNWGVLLASKSTWLGAAGAAFVHQCSTMMDLVNLQALGVQPRNKRKDKTPFVHPHSTSSSQSSGGVLESEVRTLCLENLLAGMTLSVPNYLPFSTCYAAHRSLKVAESASPATAMSLRSKRASVPVEPLAVVTLVMLVAAALCLDTVATNAPRPVIACYFLWLGWLFFEETAIKAAFFERPHPTDLFVIVAMPFATMIFGFVEGLFLGLVIASLSLVARIGSTPSAAAVRSVLTGTVLQSNAHREPQHAAYLKAWGDRRVVLVLQGLINFATAPLVLDVARREVEASASVSTAMKRRRSGTEIELLEKPPPLCLIVRCALVNALDYSAARTFVELRQVCADAKAILVVSELDERSSVVLERLGFFDEDHQNNSVHRFQDFQRALDYVEDVQLRCPMTQPDTRRSFDQDSTTEHIIEEFLGELVDQKPSKQSIQELTNAFRRENLSAGQVAWHAGEDTSQGIAIVVSGLLKTTHVDSKGIERVIEVVPPLSIVGYLSTVARAPRHVTLVADTDAQVLFLSRAAFGELVKQHPEAALLLLCAGLSRSADEYEHHVALSAEMAN